MTPSALRLDFPAPNRSRLGMSKVVISKPETCVSCFDIRASIQHGTSLPVSTASCKAVVIPFSRYWRLSMGRRVRPRLRCNVADDHRYGLEYRAPDMPAPLGRRIRKDHVSCGEGRRAAPLRTADSAIASGRRDPTRSSARALEMSPFLAERAGPSCNLRGQNERTVRAGRSGYAASFRLSRCKNRRELP